MSKEKLPLWYEKGLKFKCTGCGACCSKEPGYVWLTEKDIETAATHLNLSRNEFLKKYTRNVSGRYSLIEHPNYDCIFLKENRCSIYLSRPKQCRTFPFWEGNLESRDTWNEAALGCEGINHKDAKLLSIEEIRNWQES